MRAEDLFNQIALEWPPVIDLSDFSEAVADEDPIWNLENIYDEIDQRVWADPWLKVSAWAFHQCVIDLARSNIRSGLMDMNTTKVALSDFDKAMRANLEHPTWADEMAEYRKQNPPRP